MRSTTLRLWLIGLLVVAAVVSFVGNSTHSRFVNALGFVVFLAAVVVYATWRRTALRERRAATVSDREAPADETRTRADQ